ncbi:MAG: sensor histidine kinase [Oscillospiraceae bacterium]|jgi:two-component system sensor histidine kinase CiaH
MGILFAVFLLLLGSFDLIVYAAAENALYEEIDGQIADAEAHIKANVDGALDNFLKGRNIIYYNNSKKSYVISYRIFLLLRNQSGAILNSDYLISFDYMLNINFSPKNAGRISTEKAQRNNSVLYYRTFTMPVTASDGRLYYLQMATDSTDIEVSLQIILRVLLLCTAGALLLVLVAGWYLSKSLVQGVIEAWEKQDEFISYASHEIRSPLAVIHNSLEMLLETPGAKIIERSDLIMNSLMETSRLRKMTSNLLEMVQLQASEMRLRYETVNMEELVSDFIEPFCYQAEEANKVLDYHIQPGLKATIDRQLVTELLAILFENALKYTEAGDLIRLRMWSTEDEVVISVSDSGVGITDEAMGKIFTRFYREERQRAKSDGSGLGLFIASLIAQRHGGKISAEHNHPKGIVFTVALPLKPRK